MLKDQLSKNKFLRSEVLFTWDGTFVFIKEKHLVIS